MRVLGLVSILSVWSTNGRAHDSPPFRNHLLKEKRIIPGKKCHADKAYFAKANILKLKQSGLIPNLVPKDIEYSDSLLKKAVKEYDCESRKKNRGLMETPFGGLETEMGMKTRCRKEKHRNIFICLLGLKHNIKTYLRAQALKHLLYVFRTNLNPIEIFIKSNQMLVTMVKYQPIYVRAGRREDGTYGILRSADIVLCYQTKEEAEKSMEWKTDDVIIDIGLIVDRLLLKGDFLDISKRRKEKQKLCTRGN